MASLLTSLVEITLPVINSEVNLGLVNMNIDTVQYIIVCTLTEWKLTLHVEAILRI